MPQIKTTSYKVATVFYYELYILSPKNGLIAGV